MFCLIFSEAKRNATEERSSLRRLDTPDRTQSRSTEDGARRSCSPSRHGDSPGYRRSCPRQRTTQREYGQLRDRERELERQRERLRALEDDVYRERSRMRHTVSNHRDSSRLETDPVPRQRNESPGKDFVSSQRKRRRVEDGDSSRQSKRPASPAYSAKDVINLINSLKNVQPQPSTSVTPC